MSTPLIVIISFFGILLIFSIIIGVMGQIKSNKYQKFTKKVTKDLQINYKLAIANNKEVNVDYQLPIDEKCYYFQEDVIFSLSNKKEIRNNTIYNNELEDTNFKLFLLNNYLSIKGLNNKNSETVNIFISNKRIILQLKNENIVIWFNKIIKVSPSIFNCSWGYCTGFIIFIKNDLYYKVFSENIESASILHYWYNKYHTS